MNFKKEIDIKTAEIEQVLRQYLPKEEGHQKTIFEAMNYSVLAGGKRLRPMLMKETYRLFGGEESVIEPFMAAIEMIHTSSLVHDDLPAMDNDEYRRGRKTTWVVYGEDMAILAGDGLMIYAFETACQAFSLTRNPSRIGECLRVLANKTGIYGMIGGQTVDVELTGKDMTLEVLDFIYRLKTSALLEASMRIGAALAGATNEEQDLMESIAQDVGLAFQIRDDILDLTSTTESLGKPAGSDEKNHKTTYVTIKGLNEATGQVDQILQRALEKLHTLPMKNEFLDELIHMLIDRKK